MLKKLILTILLLSFTSCGFEIIYREDDKNSQHDYEKELAAIRINKNRTKLDQDLKNNLYDLLNPDYITVEPKYFLNLKAKKNVTSTFTTSSGASGRNRVFLEATYELRDLATGEIISNGSTIMNDNYDVTENRFGSYSAEEYAVSNLSKVVAKNIRNSLVNDLIEMRRKEAEEKDPEKLNTSKQKSK